MRDERNDAEQRYETDEEIREQQAGSEPEIEPEEQREPHGDGEDEGQSIADKRKPG